MIQKLLKFMRKTGKSKKGFTLVELMVVVVIIGILTAIAVPVYNSVTTKASQSADAANIRILQGAANTAVASHGRPSSDAVWTGALNGTAANSGGAADGNDYDWKKWVQSPFPKVPEGATSLPSTPNGSDSGTAYKVTLGSNGTVKVEKFTPGAGG